MIGSSFRPSEHREREPESSDGGDDDPGFRVQPLRGCPE
jgi:hypothetical protein